MEEERMEETEEELTASELRKLILSLQKHEFTDDEIVNLLLEMTSEKS